MDTLIPFDSLEAETLNNILVEVVTRDGTDYGNYDVSLEQKCQQAHLMLKNQQAFLVFDTESETIKLVSRDQMSQYDMD
ncbi:MAG: YheU family protein [Marinomonas sp.]|jgi:uncharacterized protein YheU (UPF0270 family)